MDNKHTQIPNDLSSAIKRYLTHGTVCDILKKKGKPVARSWDEIFEKNNTETELFQELLHDALCFSKKTVFCYDAKGVHLPELEFLNIEETPPLNALKKTSNYHVLFSKKNNGKLKAYSFYITRNAVETHILCENDLSQDARQKLWSPDSIVRLTRPIQAQTFDSIIVDTETNLLFALIDNHRYRFDESAMDMQGVLFAAIRSYCPSVSKLTPLDLFPAIKEIYGNSSEGLIHRLAFECNTGAVRDEKLKNGQLDLRQENYHTAGKNAIGGHIRPFKLGVTWIPEKYRELQCQAEIELNGTRTNLQKNAGVYSALFSSTGTLNELRFSLYKLSLYAV